MSKPIKQKDLKNTFIFVAKGLKILESVRAKTSQKFHLIKISLSSVSVSQFLPCTSTRRLTLTRQTTVKRPRRLVSKDQSETREAIG